MVRQVRFFIWPSFAISEGVQICRRKSTSRLFKVSLKPITTIIVLSSEKFQALDLFEILRVASLVHLSTSPMQLTVFYSISSWSSVSSRGHKLPSRLRSRNVLLTSETFTRSFRGRYTEEEDDKFFWPVADVSDNVLVRSCCRLHHHVYLNFSNLLFFEYLSQFEDGNVGCVIF